MTTVVLLAACISAPVKKPVTPLSKKPEANQYGITPTCPDEPAPQLNSQLTKVEGAQPGSAAASVEAGKAITAVTDTQAATQTVPQGSQSSKQTKLSDGSESGKKDLLNQKVRKDCVPKGIIQIADKFSIDPELQKQFEESVVLLKNEKYQEAIEVLETLTEKLDRFVAPHINLGIAYARTQEWEKAETSFQEALKLNEVHPVAKNELGIVYRRTGKYSEAKKLYETLLEQFPGFWPARRNLGVLCDIYLQDLQCALEQFEQYAEAKPDDKTMKIWITDVKGRMR